MTLNLPLLYVLWLEEYCQISLNKNKSPNLWHVTSILVYCIFGSGKGNNQLHLQFDPTLIFLKAHKNLSLKDTKFFFFFNAHTQKKNEIALRPKSELPLQFFLLSASLLRFFDSPMIMMMVFMGSSTLYVLERMSPSRCARFGASMNIVDFEHIWKGLINIIFYHNFGLLEQKKKTDLKAHNVKLKAIWFHIQE